MPRTAGAKNILTRVKYTENEYYYIPTTFVQRIHEECQSKGQDADTAMPKILKNYIQRMIMRGYKDAEWQFEHRAEMPENKDALECLELALANPDEEPEPDSVTKAKQVAAAKAAEELAQRQAAEEKTKFRTDDKNFHGVPRLVGKDRHPECRELPFKYIPPKHTKLLDRAFAQGKNLLLIGPAGCGKTAYAQHLATELGYACTIIGHTGHTEVEDLIGRFVPGPNGPVWLDGPLTKAVREGKTTYVADELPGSKEAVTLLYNQLLNGDGLPVVTDRGYEHLYPAEGFRFIATGNPWQEYAGMNEMSLAKITRFIPGRFDYPDATTEKKILHTNFKDIDQADLELLIKFANESRAAKAKDETKLYVVSTRSLVMVCDLIQNCGASLKEAVKQKILEEAYIVDPVEGKAMGTLIDATFRG